ncbi:MAG: N-acetylmuramoyl-L-alanine amidase [Lachnospiraceae bacterium]|nr:N-acetylmuramoyl-L-alanine amidase [Lachnospiraceae bacterium]
MQSNLMKKATVWCALFFVVSMAAILYLSKEKVITISDVAQDEVQEAGTIESDTQQVQEKHVLTFVLGESDTSYLRIPIPEGCKAESVVVENHYMDQELWVLIKGSQEAFYAANAISGNREMVEEGLYEQTADGVMLKFQLTGIFEYRTILENDDLYVSFLAPREMYDKIVVIDPACGGMNLGYLSGEIAEKNINLEIARKLKEKLDGSGIKAYYTRMDDVNPSEESRVLLANETKADMYIRIQVDSKDDEALYGTTTLYNGDYFIPGFGSVELADYLEREVVTSIKGKALGLEEAGAEEYTLRHVTVPAATVKAGCISNKQEALLLDREEYQEKIAEGLYQAILKIYEENF